MRGFFRDIEMKKNSIDFPWQKMIQLVIMAIMISSVAYLVLAAKGGMRDVFILLNDIAINSSIFVVLVPTIFGIVVGVIVISSHYRNTSEQIELEQFTFKNVKNNASKVITDVDREKIVSDLKSELKKESTKEFINEIKSTFVNNKNKQEVIDFFNESIFRMNKHIQKLSSLSMINLTIGILISGFAIAILYISVADLNLNEIPLQNITFYSFSRMGVGMAIQLLALFFLNLYKKNIYEMKYVHNEITNIESKKTAILYSYDFSEENKISIAKDLLNTERNFILDKNQTTVDIEQSKIESKESKDILSIIELVLKKDKN